MENKPAVQELTFSKRFCSRRKILISVAVTFILVVVIVVVAVLATASATTKAENGDVVGKQSVFEGMESDITLSIYTRIMNLILMPLSQNLMAF